jgi:hypothetical protein
MAGDEVAYNYVLSPEEVRERNRSYMAKRTPEQKARYWEKVVENRRKRMGVDRPKPDTCEVCGEGGRIVFDHCHNSNKFRGWLCNGCNSALGHVKDNSELLRKLADYLDA